MAIGSGVWSFALACIICATSIDAITLMKARRKFFTLKFYIQSWLRIRELKVRLFLLVWHEIDRIANKKIGDYFCIRSQIIFAMRKKHQIFHLYSIDYTKSKYPIVPISLSKSRLVRIILTQDCHFCLINGTSSIWKNPLFDPIRIKKLSLI